jgi:hypothetical protein
LEGRDVEEKRWGGREGGERGEREGEGGRGRGRVYIHVSEENGN